MNGARRYRRAALIAGLGLVLITAAVFLKRNPLAHGYRISAVFSSANQLKHGSDVRVAGIKVGQVTQIAAAPGNTSRVTMQIANTGRPIHTDATFTIEPRLVLEGNGYVEVQAGTPAAPELPEGATVPIGQTAVAVQLDQVLDTFNGATRNAFHGTIGAFNTGLGGRAPRGAIALRHAVRELNGALHSATQLGVAAQGTQPGDLHRAVASSGDFAAQLAANPAMLAGLVSDYNTVSGALAAEDQALRASIRGVSAVLRAAPPTLSALDVALPSLTRFAATTHPTLRVAPAALDQTTALLNQIGLLMRPGELATAVQDLAPVASDLPTFERRLQALFAFTKPVTDCITTHVVPTLNMKIQDGTNTTGDPVYLDLMHFFTGATAFSSAVDGNGGTVRLGITTGDRIINQFLPGLGQVVGHLPNVDGVRPTWLGFGVNPAYRPDQPCATQQLPDLNARSGPPPTWAQGR